MPSPDELPEQTRNRLLRRADWRFLLPNPRPRKSWCGAGGTLAEAVRLISESAADGEPGSEGTCDLVVAVDPETSVLRRAFDELGPGGSCYTEWYSLRSGGPNRVRRRLEGAGFEDVTCYWAWPWPSRGGTRVWLPLEAQGARRYWSRQVLEGGVAHRASRIALLTLWRLSVKLDLVLPICATARKPALGARRREGSTSASGMVGAGAPDASPTDRGVLDAVRRNWGSWGLGPAPDRLSTLLLTGGPRSISKVVGLLFGEPEAQSRLAVKRPRVADCEASLRREAATLRAIHALDPAGSLRGVPRVLFCQEYGGILALGETALGGRPVFTLLRRDNYREIALKAADWLTDLVRHTRQPRSVTDPQAIAEAVLREFHESFHSVLEPAAVGETRKLLARLPPALPSVCEQRDFSPWNVLVAADGELVVLDWESAELHGLPAMDLLYFLTNLAFFLDRAYLFSPKGAIGSGRFRESYRASLDPTTFTGRVLRECLELYARRLELDRATLQPLRLLVWLLHARSEHLQFEADAGGRPQPEALRQSVFLSLWDEELRHATGR